MTMPPEDVTVVCPECGTEYEDWYRGSINLQLDDFDEEYIEEATTATCPECGTVVEFGSLIVDAEGTWHVPVGDEEEEKQ